MRLTKIVIIVLFISGFVGAQTDSTSGTKKENPQPSKWYYGGEIGFAFSSNYFSIGFDPLVGYKITPQFSVTAPQRERSLMKQAGSRPARFTPSRCAHGTRRATATPTAT